MVDRHHPYYRRGDTRNQVVEDQDGKILQKYSEDKFRVLLAYFRDIQMITPTIDVFVVEKIRNLAEFLVFGEKYGLSHYFDLFIEENIL